MKSKFYYFLLLLLLPFLGKAQNWQPLGPDDFNQASFGDSEYSAISTTTAVPYVAFVYASKKIKVRRFVANKWETVSDGVFSGNNSSKVKIVFDGTTPYVAYRESINEGRLTVKKQIGTDWELVGTAGISGKNIQKIDFVIDNGIPYVAYTDADSQRKLMVKKFNGTSWVSVGSGDVSNVSADYPSLTLDENHIPYVVYSDSNDANKMKIKKYDSGSDNWVAISDINIQSIESPRIIFNGGILYAMYYGWGNGNKLTVSKLNGTTWQKVATDVSPGYFAGADINFNGTVPFVMYKDNKIFVKKLNATATDWETVAELKLKQSFGGGGMDPDPMMIAFLNSVPHITYLEGGSEGKTLVKKFEGSKWEDVGESGIAETSVEYFSLAANAISPYIAYSDETKDNKLTVKKHDGTNWETVGTPGFSVGGVDNINIVFDGTTPYVGYKDAAINYDLYVDRYNGTSWERLTTSAISNGGAIEGHMAINNGTVYMAYNDFGNQGKVIVKKFNVNSNAWEQIGGLVSLTYSGSIRIAFSGNVPYVAYSDNYSKLVVKKFINNIWETVGNTDINANPSDLVINNGKVYIVYADGNNNSKITVRTYDSTTLKWELFGTPFAEQSSYDAKLTFVNDVLHVAYSNYTSGGANVRKYNGNNWEVVGDSDFSAGMPRSMAISSNGSELFVAYNAGDIYAKSLSIGGTLPVALSNFDAKIKNQNQVKLTWQTASEQNNASFIISRSTDGVNFNTIANVNGKGNSNKVSNYSFVDYSPVAGTNYYRLQQKDIDGKINDLGVRAVEFKLANAEPTIYPNPTADLAKVKFNAGLFNTITLLDMNGRVLAKQSISATQHEADFNLSNYKAGTYIISLSGFKETKSYKIVKM